MATLGGLISMLVVAVVNWKFDRNLGADLRESLSVSSDDQPLGERRLADLKRQRK
jgi:hypothetical protein